MNRYPEYKESGVEWIGKIPAHWESKRLGHVSTIFKGGTPKRNVDRYFQGDLPWARPVDITALKGALYIDDTEIHISEEALSNSGARWLPAGTVLLTSRATIGETAITTVPMATNQGFSNFVCNEHLLNIYLLYYLQAIKDLLISLGSGSIYLEVTKGTLVGVKIPLPPISEQTQIANFLDQKTGKIDELIRIKERQIELLQEQRTALINQAVTKGLDPNVEMKPSGVEWIGEIPKHWEVRRNKRIFHERDDRSGTGEEELLTVSHITGVSPRAEKKNVGMFLAETLEGYKHCSVGNLVINTMWAWMGALGVSSFDGIVSPSYNVYELKSSEYVPKYYDYLYRTPNHIKEIIRWSKGIWTSRWRLYPDAFFSMFAITPPLSEQAQIANFLNRKTEQIDELVAIEQRKIELLKEYRQSLISEAVTGKIDVRNEV